MIDINILMDNQTPRQIKPVHHIKEEPDYIDIITSSRSSDSQKVSEEGLESLVPLINKLQNALS
jgi:hypothetical protein